MKIPGCLNSSQLWPVRMVSGETSDGMGAQLLFECRLNVHNANELQGILFKIQVSGLAGSMTRSTVLTPSLQRRVKANRPDTSSVPQP